MWGSFRQKRWRGSRLAVGNLEQVGCPPSSPASARAPSPARSTASALMFASVSPTTMTESVSRS